MNYLDHLVFVALILSVNPTSAQTTNFMNELRTVPDKQCVQPYYTKTPLEQEQIGNVQLKFSLNSEGDIQYAYVVPNGKFMLEQLTQRQLGGCKPSKIELGGIGYPAEITVLIPWTIPGVSEPTLTFTKECRPKYPPEAAQRRAEGITLLDVQVSERGEIMEVKLILSSGHDDLDKTALEAIKQCNATPGTSGGVAKVKKVQARFTWRNE